MDLFGKVYQGIDRTALDAVITRMLKRKIECPVCNLVITLPDISYHHWQCKSCHVTIEVKSLEKA